MGVFVTKYAIRAGAAAFAIGLAVAGPQAMGLAVADTPDTDETSRPASPRAATARAEQSGSARAPQTRGTHVTTPPPTTPQPKSATDQSAQPGAATGAVSDRGARRGAPSAAAARKSATPAPAAAIQVEPPLVARAAAEEPVSATLTVAPITAAVGVEGSAPRPSAAATASRAIRPPTLAPARSAVTAVVRFVQFFDAVTNLLNSRLPANPIGDFLSGALLLVRRTLLPGVPTIPLLTVGNATVPEGGPGNPQSAVFTITLQSAYTETVAVRYTTADGTATAGADYTPVSGLLVFTPGQTTQQVSVNIVPDSLGESDEGFRLGINPAGAGGWFGDAVLASGAGVITGGFATAAPEITIPELDSPTSTLAVRVVPTQQNADAIKVDAGTTFTLTLPGPTSDYTVLANKPALVTIAEAGNQLTLTATTPGFLGLSVKSEEGTAARYLGLYIADPVTHLVPDTVTGYLPVGSITASDAIGDAFLQDFNFRDGVAPIDYLYIYDQGGADYTDNNLRGLLTQAARHGMVPVVVFYNIQAVNTAAGSTGITEGPNSAYQAINDYNWSGSNQKDPNMFTGYMNRYFSKLATDFAAMNNVGIPVQVVMEPDFLGYMAANTPSFTPPTPFVPTPGDRTLNTAKVSSMYDAGLLTRGTDPAFPDTIAGLVQAINYYTATKAPNLRIGWKTNIWAVPDQRVYSLGLLHVTDTKTYPWQKDWGKPIGWDQGRPYIADQAAQLGAFLKKVGVTAWTGDPARTPFLAIDKYGVDGAYTFDPDMLKGGQTAVLGDLQVFLGGAYLYLESAADGDIQKYFGLTKPEFKAFYEKYGGNYTLSAPDVQAVFTTLQNAAKADPNMAKWFYNADQWNNYLLLAKTLSTTLDGTKVMLWQIPQGHINGSTDLPNRDLTNTIANFEDSATSYFFGDTFTASGGRLTHFGSNQAADPGVTVSGSTVTWGEHMTLAGQSGVLSVLFGAGLGISTRGSVTPAGGANDNNFWSDKATGYLSGVGAR